MRHPPVLLCPSAAAPPSATASEDSAAASSAHYPSAGVSSSTPHSAASFSSNGGLGSGGGGGSAYSSGSAAGVATTTTTASSSNGCPGPNSAFSGSAPSLIGPLLPSARRYVAVRLLTGETLQFDVEVKSKGKELYAAVARHMSSLGMKSSDIFGLAIQIDGEYLFVDPENKLGKYAPKGWKSSHASGLNNAGHPLLVLYFRVKFYVDSHLLIRDRVTRQHYYYQLRENVLRHGQPATEESFFRLAALALQAELGDYDPDRHRAAYFDTQLYFPQWILERVGVDYVLQNMPAMHRDHRCLSTGSAQLLYIKEASSGQIHYGLHLYRLRNSKKTDEQQQLLLQQQQQYHLPSQQRLLRAGNGSAAERADSRMSDRTTTSNASSTLDRSLTSKQMLVNADQSNDSIASSSRTLDRASHRSCSVNDNSSEHGHSHNHHPLLHHNGTVWLGICGRGIDIYEEEDSFTKTIRATFQWPNIGKLCFERKKFEIRAVGCPENRKFTYYTSSDDKSKHLLYLCRMTHQFSMAMQPKLAELRKLEEEANRHYQESLADGVAAVELSNWCDAGSSLERPDRLSLRGYGSLSKSRNGVGSGGSGGGQSHGDQRISVISSTSSNTTSGIVSDKVQSVDESDDELDMDVPSSMAPNRVSGAVGAPSLESLALAHLRDSCESLPAELEREQLQHLSSSAQQNGLPTTSGSNTSTTLPRRLAGLGARLARVGRSSNKTNPASASGVTVMKSNPSDMSRNGSLHSSSSQHSASTIHSRSRSKTPGSSGAGSCATTTANGWSCEASDLATGNTWLRANSVDVTDGVGSLRLSTQTEESSVPSCTRPETSTHGAEEGAPTSGVGGEEENQYWYSCDDDASETGSTNGEKCPGGVLCADCRLGLVSCSDSCHPPNEEEEDIPDGGGRPHHRQHHHHHHHSHHHHLHHAKGPSESSSLCVSVDHTTQDSTLSDCQSYFHSHVSSVDSSLGGSVVPSGHPLLSVPEMTNTPLAATVSALSNGGSLRSLRSGKVTGEDANNVDYSVQSGPVGDSSCSGSLGGGPKLDFTVTSAVPNTGTYPRRSTVSNTLDSDSDYVTLPPLCPRGTSLLAGENCIQGVGPHSYIFMEPMQPKNGGAQVTVANVNQLSLRHGGSGSSTGCKTPDDAASANYSAASSCSSLLNLMRTPQGMAAAAAAAAAAQAASETAARFITTRPTINVLQAHAASAVPSAQPSFAAPAQHLIPPPPYDIRQHPLYQQQQQQQQQQQSYHPAQIQSQFQSMDHQHILSASNAGPGLACYHHQYVVPASSGYASCQQHHQQQQTSDAYHIAEPPPPPPPYPVHLQAPLTTANLGLHLSQQSVSSLVSKHSLNSMDSSSRSVDAGQPNNNTAGNNNHAVYEDAASLNESKTNGSSSMYGVIATTEAEAAAATTSSNSQGVAPIIGKNNYLDLHATNTLSRRPQQPIPTQQQQQAASQQTQPSVNGAVTGSSSSSSAVPYEQYHLGIPPPPQYPGCGNHHGNNSSSASCHSSSSKQAPNFSNVYSNQVTQSQIEQFKAQLYSDVDYVIYPHKDPSLSQQEYLDVKEAASFISSAASSACYSDGHGGGSVYLPPPPPYRAPSTKSGASSVYRSSPSPCALPPASSTGGIVLSSTTPASHPPLQHLSYGYHHGNGARPGSMHYASNQSLSSGNYSSSYSTSNYSSNYSAQVPMAYVPYPSKYLSCQSLASSHSSNPSAGNYSASNCYSASSSHSLTGSYEPVGAAIQHGLMVQQQQQRCKLAPPVLSRVHSEENILTYDLPEVTTLSSAIARHQQQEASRGCHILPPPPPYRKQSLDVPVNGVGSTTNLANTSCSSSTEPTNTSASTNNVSADGKQSGPQKTPLDIKTLREKSRNLDLPLISALCNDTTLLNQAKRGKPTGNTQNQQQTQQQQQAQQSQPQQQQQQQQQVSVQPVSNIQSMPLPPTPIEAAQGKTTGQPPPKPGSGGQVNGVQQTHSYVMPRHPASVSMSQTDTAPRRPPMQLQTVARRSAAAQAATQSRPTSWHLEGNNWNSNGSQLVIDPSAVSGIVNGGDKNGAPPLPPPNCNSSAIEAKLAQLQKAAVAIATGPGSIIAEDGKIAKALNLPAFAKSVKNSYVVSPSRKHPVSGLYAVTELGKPPTGARKVTTTGFSHPHSGSNNGGSNGSKVNQHSAMSNTTTLSNSKNSFSVAP